MSALSRRFACLFVSCVVPLRSLTFRLVVVSVVPVGAIASVDVDAEYAELLADLAREDHKSKNNNEEKTETVEATASSSSVAVPPTAQINVAPTPRTAAVPATASTPSKSSSSKTLIDA